MQLSASERRLVLVSSHMLWFRQVCKTWVHAADSRRTFVLVKSLPIEPEELAAGASEHSDAELPIRPP